MTTDNKKRDYFTRLKIELIALQSIVEALDRYVHNNDDINWLTASTYAEMIRERSEKILTEFGQ